MAPKSHASIAAVMALLLALVLMPQSAHASAISSYCSVAIPSGTSGVLAHPTSLDSLILIASLVMLLMATVSGFIFAIGYTLKIDKLVRFSKAEIGEILVTAVIAFVFLGTFSVTNSVSGPSGLFYASGGALNSGIFSNDCTQLAGTSLSLIQPLIGVGIQDDMYSMLSSVTVSIKPNDWGLSFKPFTGFYSVIAVIDTFMSVAGGLIGISFAITFFLALIYAVFPLFLYLGIVLRTLPWTRAAGGSFLGLFMGFYIMFPLLMHYALAVNTVSVLTISQNGGLTGIVSSLLGGINNPFTALSNIISITSTSIYPSALVGSLVQSIIGPALYVVFALVISLIISFDFTETVGDFLGAPSLSSKTALKGVI